MITVWNVQPSYFMLLYQPLFYKHVQPRDVVSHLLDLE